MQLAPHRSSPCGHTQCPSRQLSGAWQTTPQAPQFWSSWLTYTQLSPQRLRPIGQAIAPLTSVLPAMPLEVPALATGALSL